MFIKIELIFFNAFVQDLSLFVVLQIYVFPNEFCQILINNLLLLYSILDISLCSTYLNIGNVFLILKYYCFYVYHAFCCLKLNITSVINVLLNELHNILQILIWILYIIKHLVKQLLFLVILTFKLLALLMNPWIKVIDFFFHQSHIRNSNILLQTLY